MSSNIHTIHDSSPPPPASPPAGKKNTKTTIIALGIILTLGIILSIAGALIKTQVKDPIAQSLLGIPIATIGGIISSICIMLIILWIIKRVNI